MREVKCPKCGFEWMEDLNKIYEDGQISITRSLAPTTSYLNKEKFVDFVCPKCKYEFELSWEE